MYAFARRPAWIVSHVLVAALVITMINLGLWQLRRLEARQDLNVLLEERADGAPRDLAVVVASVDVPGEGDAVKFQYVAGTLTYDPEREFSVENRSLDGAPGRWVVTPATVPGLDEELLVVRGFVPQVVEGDGPPVPGVEPPSGTVDVQGWLNDTETPNALQPDDPWISDTRVSRLDLERIDDRLDAEIAPVWLQLESQSPPTDAELLTPIPLPDRTDGPHLGYAVQWGIFSAVALIGYPLILRRVARTRHEGSGSDDGDVE